MKFSPETKYFRVPMETVHVILVVSGPSLRLFLMATWKSGLGNDIYYIHRSVKPVKWPVADGGEEKVVFLREFF